MTKSCGLVFKMSARAMMSSRVAIDRASSSSGSNLEHYYISTANRLQGKVSNRVQNPCINKYIYYLPLLHSYIIHLSRGNCNFLECIDHFLISIYSNSILCFVFMDLISQAMTFFLSFKGSLVGLGVHCTAIVVGPLTEELFYGFP